MSRPFNEHNYGQESYGTLKSTPDAPPDLPLVDRLERLCTRLDGVLGVTGAVRSALGPRPYVSGHISEEEQSATMHYFVTTLERIAGDLDEEITDISRIIRG